MAAAVSNICDPLVYRDSAVNSAAYKCSDLLQGPMLPHSFQGQHIRASTSV